MPIVHLADAHIEASESPSRQDKEDKHHPWLYVVMWMADVDGQPVGSSARWPPRKGHAPSWHSARLVGEGSSVNSAICDLRVELWQQADKGAQHMVAGPAVLPVAELATTPTNVSLALHGPSTAKPTSYAIQLHVVAEAPTRKSLFLIRHAESKWNAAKRDKNVYKMVRQHDHPINEHGYKQAASLQARLTAAAEDERQRPNEPDSKPSLAHKLMNAEAFWCSPLTRAVQTALVGLEPVLRMPGKRLELKINAREKKNWGGFDSTGIVMGAACGQRALAELRAISTSETPTEAEVTTKLSRLRMEVVETEHNTWWAEGPESDDDLSQRMEELLLQIQHSPATSIVLVGHSHFFRGFFQRYLHPLVHHRAPEVARELQTSSVPNCTVLHCALDFGCAPFVVTNVTELQLGDAAGAAPGGGAKHASAATASRPASAHMSARVAAAERASANAHSHRTSSV